MTDMKDKIKASRFIASVNSVIDNWSRSSNNYTSWLRMYTLVFILLFLLSFGVLLFNGKTLMWNVDGRNQMLPWLSYTGIWIRNIVSNIFHGNFSIPMFDLSLGWGDDIIGYMAASGQLEPLNMFFSALVPAQYTEYLYNFLVIVRLYLAGLSFISLCRYFKKPYFASMMGSIVYLFNAYTIYCAPSFSYFINAMIALPLLIIGVDKIIKRQYSIGFIICSAYAALCGFYLLYMMTFSMGVYAIVSWLTTYSGKERLRILPKLLFRGVGSYILGLLLAAPFFLPSLGEFLNAARSGWTNLVVSNDFSTQWSFFWSRVLSLIAPKENCSWDWGLDYPAYAAIALVAIGLLFASKGRKRLKWLTGISLFAYFCFLGGWILNGFQYVCNRWSFALALLVGFVVVDIFPNILNLNKKEKYVCYGLICAYAIIPLLSFDMRNYVYFEFGMMFLVITIAILLFMQKRNINEKYKKTIIFGIVAWNIITNSFCMLSGHYTGWGAKFDPLGYAAIQLEEGLERDISDEDIMNNTDGRVDSSQYNLNDAMIYGIPGTIFYNSVENENVIAFLKSMEGSCNVMYFKVYSTDQRTIENTLISNKYQIEKARRSTYVPYGYELISTTDKGNSVYNNNYSLGWGYTYDKSVKYNILEDLNGIDKQEALLQAVAIEHDSNLPTLELLETENYQIPYEINMKSANWNDEILEIHNTNNRIEIIANLDAGKEYYVRLKGFKKVSDKDSDNTAVISSVKVASTGIYKEGWVKSDEYAWYDGTENFLFCLGYSDVDRDTIGISVSEKGKYKLEDIEVFALPLDSYPERIEALRSEPLENIQFTTNQISGTVDLSKDKILCLTVPFSKGWTAYVDGEKAEILRANYAFIGLELSEGHHDIVFKYCSPGIKLGCILFVVSLSVTIALIVVDRKKRKNIEAV